MKKIEKMTSAELKVFLEDRKMPTTGNKTELLLRAKKAVAEQPSSSTPVRQERDVTNDPDHVASSTVAEGGAAVANANDNEDDEAQPNATEGEKQEPLVAASGGEDKCADAFMIDHNVDASDSEDSNDFDYEAKRHAIDQWQKIEELKDALEEEEWSIKHEQEKRERQIQADLARRRREIRRQYELHVLHCQQTGLPVPDPLDDVELQKPVEKRQPVTGKTVTSTSTTDNATDHVGNYDVDSTVPKMKTIVLTASDRVCSDYKQATSHVTAQTTATPDVRPKTSSTILPAASTNTTPIITPRPKPRVSIMPDFNEKRAVYDSNGKFVGYVSDAGGLVLTDPHATAQLTTQAATTASMTPPITLANPTTMPLSTPVTYAPQLDPNVSAFQPSFTSNQGNDGSLKQLIDIMSLPKPNLVTFNGDPLRYNVFINAFDSCIHNASVTDASKLNRLHELCQGKARTLIEPCALMEPTEGYIEARRLLKEIR